MARLLACLFHFYYSPVLTIGMISAVGDGASKKEAKHKAAEALAYILLPEV